ncbi:MAG: transglutaminase-like domain-containing protein [Candidatus Aenigmatarchaeota archaeon]
MEDNRKYLDSSYFCESDFKKVVDTAERVAGSLDVKRDKAKELFNWVRDEYTWKVRKIVGARGVLKRDKREALCMDNTNLLIALCRSQGIPARYLIMKCDIENKKKEEPDTILHAVAEIKVNDKWEVADPAFGEKTKDIVDVAKFGEKSWLKAYSKKRRTSLPRYIPFFFNNFIYYLSPSLWKLKKKLDNL